MYFLYGFAQGRRRRQRRRHPSVCALVAHSKSQNFGRFVHTLTHTNTKRNGVIRLATAAAAAIGFEVIVVRHTATFARTDASTKARVVLLHIAAHIRAALETRTAEMGERVLRASECVRAPTCWVTGELRVVVVLASSLSVR